MNSYIIYLKYDLLFNLSFLSAPCPPVLQIFPRSCISNQVVVSWTRVQDALSVTVNGTSTLGHSVGCISVNNSCTLQGLWCGQRYTVQGISYSQWCNSTPSVPLSIVTGMTTQITYSGDSSEGRYY